MVPPIGPAAIRGEGRVRIGDCLVELFDFCQVELTVHVPHRQAIHRVPPRGSEVQYCCSDWGHAASDSVAECECSEGVV